MKRKRHTPEEIIKKLREAAGLIAGGKTAEEAARQIGVSVPTYHRWKEQHGGAEKSTVKRLKDTITTWLSGAGVSGQHWENG